MRKLTRAGMVGEEAVIMYVLLRLASCFRDSSLISESLATG